MLRDADADKNLEAVCCKHNVSAASFYRWKKKFGGMEFKDARKYRQLESENNELEADARRQSAQDQAGNTKRSNAVAAA